MKKAAIVVALLASHAYVAYVFYWTGVEDTAIPTIPEEVYPPGTGPGGF